MYRQFCLGSMRNVCAKRFQGPWSMYSSLPTIVAWLWPPPATSSLKRHPFLTTGWSLKQVTPRRKDTCHPRPHVQAATSAACAGLGHTMPPHLNIRLLVCSARAAMTVTCHQCIFRTIATSCSFGSKPKQAHSSAVPLYYHP